MRKILLIICWLISLQAIEAKDVHSFEIKNGNFVYDGKPVQIHSGEMHFARVPKPYWRQRLQMIKAMGLNTVATYVFWNHHEIAPGVWDFKTENRDIAAFIKMAGEEGLMVILRPGPYACAEWEFGGYPWWLQKEKSLVIRANNKPFLDSCKVYINKLAEQVKGLQINYGGPLIMVQAENEFGSYVSQRPDIPLTEHKAYSAAIKQQLVDAGFVVPLFTSDGSWIFEGGSIAGALPTANGENDITKLKKVVNQYNNGQGPYMVAEFYPGWLDHWGEAFVRVSTDKVIAQTKKYLDSSISFNYYMVHGGTNFGFTSGANYKKNADLQPDITSYDYDAPISEAGWATPKYKAIRELMLQYVKYKVPEIPKAAPVIAIPNISLDKTTDLLLLKDKMKPVESEQPGSFEELNQGHGYVLYSRHFNQPISGLLTIKGLRDFAVVYVNGEKVGVLDRTQNKYSCEIDVPFDATLDILVENMGRINYGADIVHNLKGIISPVTIADNEITGGWEMYQFPMDKEPKLDKQQGTYHKDHPVVYQGKFNLAKTGDTFLDMSKWGKGIVFINGYNIGRYWNIGPQQTLYVPGCWLKEGENRISIFEQLNEVKQTAIDAVTVPVLDDLRRKN